MDANDALKGDPMYTRWITTLAILTLLVAPAALAQGDQEIRGTVTAKDPATLTIETEQGQTVSFEITEHSLLPEELSIGDKVAVHHRVSTGDSNLQPITEVLIADQLEALPQTASPLAALALIGFTAMATATGLRRRRS
jgi:hypothetical protein